MNPDERVRKMKTMGVTELEGSLGDILREIQESGETIEVTRDGEPVARVVPLLKRLSIQEREAEIRDLDALAAQISAHWPEGVTALEAVRDVRRDL